MDSQQTQILKVVIGCFDAPLGNDLLAVATNYVNVWGLQAGAVELASTPLFQSNIVGGNEADDIAALMSNFGFVPDSDPASAGSLAQTYITERIAAGDDYGLIIYNIVVFLSSDVAIAANPQFTEAATLLSNKAAVAVAYSNVVPVTGDDLIASGSVFDTVDGVDPITNAEIATIIANSVGVDTFVLTNETDIVSAHNFTSGLVYTPGGDDRINALQDEDILTGIGDAATLTATLGNANDNGSNVITPGLINIATVNAAFTGSGFGAVNGLDLQDATGLHTINVTRVSESIDNAEIGNIQDASVSELSLSNTNANQAGTVEFSYAAGVLAGDNTVSLELDNVQLGTLNIGQNTSGINGLGVSLEGYENVTLVSNGGANTVGTLNLPMDTGTAGSLIIEGGGDLTIGGKANVVNAANNTLVEVKDLYTAGSGIAQAGGRIAAIDASSFAGNLTLVLDNILDVGKADTSGADQNVTVTGGIGDDTFVLYDAVQAGDSISGGDGNDTLLFYSGSTLDSLATGIENAGIYADGSIAAGQVSVDFDNLTEVSAVTVRNISSDVDLAGFGGDFVLENSADAAVNVTLTDMSATQATGITMQHSTTGNNQIQNTTLTTAVKTDTANDTLGVTIADGNNVDPRFNFSIVTAIPGNASTIENVTLTDSDTESNSVELTNFATHTGTITLAGGEVGDFINLDVDTAGGDVTGIYDGGTNILPAPVDYGQIQQGFLGINTDGTAAPAGFVPQTQDVTAGHFFDVSGVASQVRLGAATIDASAEEANVILRVSTNAASAVGAQTITTGSGNDHVIFDNLNDTRAGLTISDHVTGGEGDDTLVIDGTGVRISLGASEWTNVNGFETLQIVGTSSAPVSTLLGQNAYNLTLTNDLIQSNGSGMIHIINDNDANNDQSGTTTATQYLNTAGTAQESGVTLDARTLNAANHFTYNGEEGDIGVFSGTADRFMFSDANINGGNVIDGGALDNLSDTNSIANGDVMEVRNTATVTAGDMQGLSNIGTIAGVNDQAVAQTLDLELTDSVIDALVDSYHAASTTEIETVFVRLNDALDIAAPVAGMGLTLDAKAMTFKTSADVTLDGAYATNDIITLGSGFLTVNNFVIGGQDRIELSVSKFGLTLDADDVGLNANTDFGVDGTNVLFGAVAAAATDRIIIDDTGVDTNIYFDSDGNGAGAQVQIASIVGGTGLVAADVFIVS